MIFYGIDPSATSKPFWGDNSYNEDNIIASIDFHVSLQKLKPIQREIILLYNQGYSKREIAEKINLPETTTQDIKQRAIFRLKEMMNGGGRIFEED